MKNRIQNHVQSKLDKKLEQEKNRLQNKINSIEAEPDFDSIENDQNIYSRSLHNPNETECSHLKERYNKYLKPLGFFNNWKVEDFA